MKTSENQIPSPRPEIQIKIIELSCGSLKVPGDYPGHMHTNALQTRAKSVHYRPEPDMVEMWEIVPGT